jgi:hypothetical protein
VGLRRLVRERGRRGRADVPIVVRSWPLELVNGHPLDPALVAAEVEALRPVAPELFARFAPGRFPSTSIPALELVALGYACDAATGEHFALAARDALFEEGRDISDPDVLRSIARSAGVAGPAPDDRSHVLADLREGLARDVIGSPHFFVGEHDYFCPALDIRHTEDGFVVDRDLEAFNRFVEDCFGP